MKAVAFERTGPPDEVLSVRDAPTPTPRRGEVLVRMLASPVNPSDLLYIQGNYTVPPALPATPGFEGVGVVEASGGGMLGGFLKGRRVVALNDRSGNWAEFAIVDARRCIPVPSDIPDDQAATFFVNPATVVALTQHVLDIPPGAFLLQTAAGSALGKMLIRLGKLAGYRTINVVRRREQVGELSALGADHVLVEADGPLAEQVKKKVGVNGVPFVIDAVGGETGSQAVRCLALGGRAVLYGLLSGQAVTLDPRFLITGSKSVEGFWLGDWVKRRSLLKKLKLIRKIRKLMRAGILTTEIASTYPLDQVREAVRHAAAPGKGGKVLLRIAPGP